MKNTSIENLIVICNVNINQLTGDTREGFLSKVRSVRAIRCWWRQNHTSIYLTSKYELWGVKYLYDIVNYGVFNSTDYHYYRFAIGLPSNTYYWLLNTDLEVIQKQIVNWMAFQYFYQYEKREIYDDQYYAPALQEVKAYIRQFYDKILREKAGVSAEDIMKGHDLLSWTDAEFVSFYHQTCLAIYGELPPSFILNPFDWYSEADDWGLSGFDIGILEAYFTETDWDNVIIEGKSDSLYRVESRSDVWDKWLHTFTTFEESHRTIYSFYLADNLKEKITRKTNDLPEVEIDFEKIISLLADHQFERVFTELESNKSHLTLDQKEMLTMLAMRHSRLVKHQIKGIVDKLYLEENKLAYDLLRFIQVIKKR
ncbi:MAG: hypothetical protein KDD14_05075 [Saprospiraceae bacterium]|nr:hypothetical protein [Saprospiraceae bacterium]